MEYSNKQVSNVTHRSLLDELTSNATLKEIKGLFVGLIFHEYILQIDVISLADVRCFRWCLSPYSKTHLLATVNNTLWLFLKRLFFLPVGIKTVVILFCSLDICLLHIFLDPTGRWYRTVLSPNIYKTNITFVLKLEF